MLAPVMAGQGGASLFTPEQLLMYLPAMIGMTYAIAVAPLGTVLAMMRGARWSVIVRIVLSGHLLCLLGWLITAMLWETIREHWQFIAACQLVAFIGWVYHGVAVILLWRIRQNALSRSSPCIADLDWQAPEPEPMDETARLSVRGFWRNLWVDLICTWLLNRQARLTGIALGVGALAAAIYWRDPLLPGVVGLGYLTVIRFYARPARRRANELLLAQPSAPDDQRLRRALVRALPEPAWRRPPATGRNPTAR